MEDKYIVEFALTIINTGIKNKLSDQQIITGLKTYISYLKKLELASSNALSSLNILVETVPLLTKEAIKDEKKEAYERAVGLRRTAKSYYEKNVPSTEEVQEKTTHEETITPTNTSSSCDTIGRHIPTRDDYVMDGCGSGPEPEITRSEPVSISYGCDSPRHIPTRDDYVMGGCGSSPERSTSSSSDYSSSAGWDIIGEDRHTYEKSRC